MAGYLALVLHAHLPFVRHPEHERFLEESWLYEAITETYLPLVELLQAWERDRVNARLTVALSPTLCSMLLDPLLQARYESRLAGLIELAEKETFRTQWDRALQPLAARNLERFCRLRELWRGCGRDLVGAFRGLQERGRLEIITCAATHALLPLLADHPPSLRGQILTARDHYRACFGRDPVGIWLPECGYTPAVEPYLREANLRWFIVDTHGLLHATPRPRYAVFAPVFTPQGLAVFGRDVESAKQVWSRNEGYPGDPRYRDFYRDMGFDLDFDYLRPYLPSPDHRGFTGIKYYRISGPAGEKQVYAPEVAEAAAREHARHFLSGRLAQLGRLEEIMDRPPVLVAPYDAELFGHWWHEGLLFLDVLVREALRDPPAFSLVTPTDYLRQQATHQVVRPSASSWGEAGHLRVWLNEKNDWILPHLRVAQARMTEVVGALSQPTELEARALRQAARELMLAQASDWPFILHTGTSPGYALHRVNHHLLNFLRLHEQLTARKVDEAILSRIESQDLLFAQVDWRYWR
ncbi:MAG: DUF1957 domain-containing protein [Verrucomicrobia bacterium]|nr:DUF1957 domain-containing protein [Verrucomicrobiota bacterium]